MTVSEIAGIIGAITGGISILGVVYTLGIKFGHINTKLKEIENKLIDPVKFGGACNQVETLYKVYVLDALPRRRNKNNPESNNPKNKIFKISNELLDLIEKITLEHLNKDEPEIVSEILEKIAASNPDILLDMLKKDYKFNQLINAIYNKVIKFKEEYQKK